MTTGGGQCCAGGTRVGRGVLGGYLGESNSRVTGRRRRRSLTGIELTLVSRYGHRKGMVRPVSLVQGLRYGARQVTGGGLFL